MKNISRCTTRRTRSASSPTPSRAKSSWSRALINVETKGGVGRVTLDRPEVRNAFDDALIAELTKTFRQLDADRAVRAVVLAGNGPAFCAGADLNWMKRMSGYSYDENVRDARGLAEMLSTLARM